MSYRTEPQEDSRIRSLGGFQVGVHFRAEDTLTSPLYFSIVVLAPPPPPTKPFQLNSPKPVHILLLITV